ncbi:MAG: hypothetical protein LBV71_10600 [Prevotella sp.]|jgi:hypothetical protein|nr:hypothetical protein [Prevotella sp.]
MKNIILTLLFIGLFVSCTEKKSPIIHDDEQANNLTMDSLLEDTTKVLNVDLPTLIDSVNQILVHEIRISSGKGRDLSFSSKKSGDYYGVGSGLINLIFEDVKNNKSYLLTNNQLQISSYEVCSRLKVKIGKAYILFRVIDKDYNNDGVLDGRDTQGLYISNLDGTSFSKITKDNEMLRNGEWMYPLNRYYFRTTEDSDKNGYFDFKDKIHYYYIQFEEQGYQVMEYNPLEMLNK